MTQRRNWSRIAQRDRARRRGTEDAAHTPSFMAPLLAGARRQQPSKNELRDQLAAAMTATAAASAPAAARAVDPIGEPLLIDRFWRNRRGEAVAVSLRRFKGRVLVDCIVQATSPAGKLEPTGRGLSLLLARLPDLQKALCKAEKRATELGLLKPGGAP